MTKTKIAAIAGVAIAGLIAGSGTRIQASSLLAGRGASFDPQDETRDNKKSGGGSTKRVKEKHACKGQNSCKGKGGCKSSDNGCKGKNSCKGKGGCASDGSKMPSEEKKPS